jgi:hypothetical protein
MSRFQTKKQSRTVTTQHKNWMGGAAYFLSDPVRTLEIAAASCFFGEPMYYHRDPDDTRPLRYNHQHGCLTMTSCIYVKRSTRSSRLIGAT